MTKRRQYDGNQARIVLFWIELYIREKKRKDLNVNIKFDAFSVEHIFPQKYDAPDSDWDKDDNWKLSETEVVTDKKQFIQQIGNLTLLDSKTNSKVSNSSWKEKREEYRKTTECLITTDEEFLDLKISNWNAEEIQKRTKKLMEIFFNVWKLE